jgi:hypothetical protein
LILISEKQLEEKTMDKKAAAIIAVILITSAAIALVITLIVNILYPSEAHAGQPHQSRCYAETKKMLRQQDQYFNKLARDMGWGSKQSIELRKAVFSADLMQMRFIDSRCNGKGVKLCKKTVKWKRNRAVARGVKFSAKADKMLAARCTPQ